MNPTLFAQFIGWFSGMATRFVERWNGRSEAPTYLYKEMLTPEESLDLKWDSVDFNNAVVMADVVALDSPLPLKERPAIQAANGVIPKIGTKRQKSETLITEIGVMTSQGRQPAEIANRIFNQDIRFCTTAVWERLEDMFLTGISTGVTLVPDTENVGTGIRVDFGVPAANRRGVAVPWGTTGYTPITDINNAIAYASDTNGDVITTIMMNLATFNQLRTSDEARFEFASFNGYAPTDNTPVPGRNAFIDLLQSNLGVRVIVVNRSTTWEKNGARTAKQPFAANTIVLLTSEQVGRLVWGQLGEMRYPVNGVEYATVDNFILLSEYSKNDPLREFTSSQALALTVIDNASSIYYIDTTTVQG